MSEIIFESHNHLQGKAHTFTIESHNNRLRCYLARLRRKTHCDPAEHLWNELREKCTANRLFATLDAVEESIKTGLDELAADAVRLTKITRFSWIQNWLLYL